MAVPIHRSYVTSSFKDCNTSSEVPELACELQCSVRKVEFRDSINITVEGLSHLQHGPQAVSPGFLSPPTLRSGVTAPYQEAAPTPDLDSHNLRHLIERYVRVHHDQGSLRQVRWSLQQKQIPFGLADGP